MVYADTRSIFTIMYPDGFSKPKVGRLSLVKYKARLEYRYPDSSPNRRTEIRIKDTYSISIVDAASRGRGEGTRMLVSSTCFASLFMLR